jgi:hypothetical protein
LEKQKRNLSDKIIHQRAKCIELRLIRCILRSAPPLSLKKRNRESKRAYAKAEKLHLVSLQVREVQQDKYGGKKGGGGMEKQK